MSVMRSRHVFPSRHHPGEIARRSNIHDVLFSGFRIEFVDIAGLLEHDRAGAGVKRFDVEVGEFGDLRQLLPFRVVRPDIRHAVTIGDEVDRVAHPHGIHVFGIGPGRRNEVVALEIDDPDRAVLPAAVVAPFLIPGVVHPIGDVRAVGGDLTLITAGQRQRLFDATLRGHSPEARRSRRSPGRARGRKKDRLAVRGPSLLPVGARMPGETARLAAVRGHDVHVGVPRIFSAERDPLSVR